MNQEIKNRINALYKMDKETLQSIVARSHRVCDLRGVGKDLLVSMILEAEYGRKAMDNFVQAQEQSRFEAAVPDRDNEELWGKR